MPKVSVIIPTYNRAALLRRALTSVFAQTFRDFEVLVADDGSTDETAEVCRSFTEVRYVALPHSGLPAVARNRALDVASGEYIAFLDSDDEWVENKLETQVGILEGAPSFGLACSNAEVAGEMYLRPDQGKNGMALLTLIGDNFVVTSTAMVRRNALQSVGQFCEEPALRGVEDYDLWLRIASHSGVAYEPKALAVYHRSATSLGQEQGGALHWAGLSRIFERMKTLPDLDTAALKAIDRRIEECRGMLCDSHAVARNYRGFTQTWTGFLRTNPAAALGYLGRTAAKIRKSGAAVAPSENVPPGLRLHLGCGERYLEGYVNIDLPAASHTVQSGKTPDLHVDFTTMRYAASSVDEVRLHHVFEHFDRSTALRLLIEWYEWLREGGKLVIETPDVAASLQGLADSASPELQFRTLRHLFGSHEAEWALHKDGWYARKFEIYLRELGYQIVACKPNSWQGTHNITVTAIKVAPAKTRRDLLAAAEKLLRMSLVDTSASEMKTLEVWMNQLRAGLDRPS
jgi:GT2 family glycosyltransferase/predicted SAM-dependent methyltransferase